MVEKTTEGTLTRRAVLAAALAPAVEVTAPATAEERLREAVHRWRRAVRAVEEARRAYQGARAAIYDAMEEDSPARTLARLVQAREAARAEWRSARREEAEAEQAMEAAARVGREG